MHYRNTSGTYNYLFWNIMFTFITHIYVSSNSKWTNEKVNNSYADMYKNLMEL